MKDWREEFHTIELNGHQFDIKLYVEWEVYHRPSSDDEVQEGPEISAFKSQVYQDRKEDGWWPVTLPHFLLDAILPTDEMMIAWSEE